MAGCISKSNPNKLGGGLPGGQPKGGLLGGGAGSTGGSGMVGGGERGRDRLVLRKAFGRFMVIDAATDDSFGILEGALFQGAGLFTAGQQGASSLRCKLCINLGICKGVDKCECAENARNWDWCNLSWPSPGCPVACALNWAKCKERIRYPNSPPCFQECCNASGIIPSPSGFSPSGVSGVFTDDIVDDDYVDLDGDGYADPTPGTCARDVYKIPLTPFRQAFNAGDSQGTVNNSVLAELNAPNQVGGVGAGQNIFSRAGGAHKGGQAAYTGNPRYVYDSSDYIRFKKLQAKNRNYNDKSFGGANNGAYVPLMRIRH